MKKAIVIILISFMLLFSSYAIIGFDLDDSEDYDSQFYQLVVTVNDDYGPSTPGWGRVSFDNVQDGISAVMNNGLIFIYPGTYDRFNVNKPCKVMGLNKDLVIIDGNETGNAIEISSSNSFIANLNITGVNSSCGNESVFNSAITDYISICALDSSHIAVAYNDEGNHQYGTVRVASVSDNNPTWGAESIFNTAQTDYISICALDSSHIAVAYSDRGNNDYGTVRIAFVSGTTLNWGAESVFNSASSTYSISICALDSSHIAVAYQDFANNQYGTVRIASVSGTNPTWGAESVFNSATTDYASICALDSNHIAVAYRDHGNNDFGTVRIASVSGTTPTWGAESVFNSASTLCTSICSLDSLHIAVSYQDHGNNDFGTVRIASVSGTTPTWGIESVFNSARTWYMPICALDSSHIAVTYSDYGNNNYGSARIASVSGTTPTWSFKSIFNSAITWYISICALDSSHIAVAYEDYGNNKYGTVRIGSGDFSSYLIVINNTANDNTIQNCYFQYIPYSDGGKVSVIGNGNNFLANTGSTFLLCNSSNNHIHNNTCFWRMLFTGNNNTIEYNSPASYEGSTKLNIDFRNGISSNNIIKCNECNHIWLESFSNGYILSNICHNSTYGITLNTSNDNVIYGNVLENCDYGVYIE